MTRPPGTSGQAGYVSAKAYWVPTFGRRLVGLLFDVQSHLASVTSAALGSVSSDRNSLEQRGQKAAQRRNVGPRQWG